MTRPSRIAVGLILVALGMAQLFTGQPGEKLLHLLIGFGALVGGTCNALLRKHRGVSLSWKNVANGAWLGAIVAPVVSALLLGGGGTTAGEYFGYSLVMGLIVGYGLGLLIGGTLLLNDTKASVASSDERFGASPSDTEASRSD